MHAWRSPEAYEQTEFPALRAPSVSFSLIMPCRDERLDVMEATLQRLVEQTHPAVEIILSVGHDDPETTANARLLASLNSMVRVSVNYDETKNKPRQLNSALTMCRGDVVGVVDAESLTSRGLLDAVDSTFQATQADAVQGAVQLVNLRSRWFTLRNCLEYRIWFRSRLHGHAQSGFIPLGGNTVFIWRQLLNDIGGWDSDCLAEDCDLGVRLSVLGKKVVCVYSPSLTTREEAPQTVRAFVRQRTRWAVGFMQVLGKGDWKKLPWRRRVVAWWMLVQQNAVALAGLLIPFGFVTALVLKAPTWVAMLSYVPLIPLILTVGFEIIVLRDLGIDMSLQIRPRDYWILVFSTPFYSALLLYSAVGAFVKYRAGDFRWDKTPHTGDHLGLASQSPSRASAIAAARDHRGAQ